MIDLALERRLESCKQLMQDWHAFHGYLTACMKNTKFDARAEADFLQLKSQIALLHDAFLESIDTSTREAAAVSQTIITIIERCILLRQMIKMTPAELKKMEMEWHEAYLLINETIGIVEDQIAKLASEGATHHFLDLYGWRNIKRAFGFLTGKAFVGTVVGLVLLVALVVLPLFNVFSYNVLDTFPSTKASYRFVRNMLRAPFPNIMYRDWDDYVTCNVKKDEKYSSATADDKREKEFVDLLTSSGTLDKVIKKEMTRYHRDTDYDTFVVMFDNLASAKDAYDVATKRRPGFNGGVVEYDKKYQIERSANVVAIASPPTTNNSPLVPDVLRLVIARH